MAALLLVTLFALVASSAASPGFPLNPKNLIQFETPPTVERDQRLEFPLAGEGSSFKFKFADVPVSGSRVDNAAVLQLQVDKIQNKFLATLPIPGSAQFLTVLKPCGILLPHVHQRATEFYSVLFGKMDAGIAQENGGLQNITFTIEPGEVFIAPQGLVHYNHNRQCRALAFFQSFNSADPGALNIAGALGGFRLSGEAGAAAMKATTAEGVQPLGAFVLDKDCARRCRLDPVKGAPGDGLDTLDPVIKKLFGL